MASNVPCSGRVPISCCAGIGDVSVRRLEGLISKIGWNKDIVESDTGLLTVRWHDLNKFLIWFPINSASHSYEQKMLRKLEKISGLGNVRSNLNIIFIACISVDENMHVKLI